MLLTMNLTCHPWAKVIFKIILIDVVSTIGENVSMKSKPGV